MSTEVDLSSKQAEETTLAPEIRRILRENNELKRRLRGFEGQNAVLRAKVTESEVKSSLPKSTEAENKPQEAAKPHFVGGWQKFCTDCGETNPDFKDEIKCKDCDMHLGAKANIEKLKACPNCGAKEAVEI